MDLRKSITLFSISILLMISCGEKERIVEVPVPVDCAPSAPRGVFSVNMYDRVRIIWYPNPESDVAGYDVYRGESLYGDYFYIGSVDDVEPDPPDYYFDDLDVEPGRQYFYAVVAYDRAGNESDLSYEEVSGTPRPEGVITLYDMDDLPDQSGYDLSSLSGVPQRYNLEDTDIYFDHGSDGVARILVYRAGVVIKDYGFTGDFDAVNLAPEEGWSPSGEVEAVAGHCYILRTLEADGYHYAKLYVTEVTSQFVTFAWAFQIDPGNRDLVPFNGVGKEENEPKTGRGL